MRPSMSNRGKYRGVKYAHFVIFYFHAERTYSTYFATTTPPHVFKFNYPIQKLILLIFNSTKFKKKNKEEWYVFYPKK